MSLEIEMSEIFMKLVFISASDYNEISSPGSVCNSALGGQPRPGARSRWLVCWCQAGLWDKCVIK